MPKRPTITDIAKAIGVTDGTVSRALRNDPRVKAETRERVLEAAKAAGYIPNLSARNFKEGKTHNIGIFCDAGSWMLYNNYFGRLIAGLTEAAQAQNYRTVIYLPEEIGTCPGVNPDKLMVRLKGPQEFHDGRVDAAVVVGGRSTLKTDLDELKQMHVPVVLLSNNSPAVDFFEMRAGARERVSTLR